MPIKRRQRKSRPERRLPRFGDPDRDSGNGHLPIFGAGEGQRLLFESRHREKPQRPRRSLYGLPKQSGFFRSKHDHLWPPREKRQSLSSSFGLRRPGVCEDGTENRRGYGKRAEGVRNFAAYKAGPYEDFRSVQYEGKRLAAFHTRLEKSILKGPLRWQGEKIITLQLCLGKEERMVALWRKCKQIKRLIGKRGAFCFYNFLLD